MWHACEHMPSIVHATELTQPLGHSTSGSHERYKSKERLEWEAEFDCLKKFREWIIAQGMASSAELDQMEAEDLQTVEDARRRAWEAYIQPIEQERGQVAGLIEDLANRSSQKEALAQVMARLVGIPIPLRRDLSVAIHQALTLVSGRARAGPPAFDRLAPAASKKPAAERYDSYLYLSGPGSVLSVPEVKPIYSENAPVLNGFEVLNANFDAILKREPRFIAFGEDVGRLGDVNQGFRGLQEKYGPLRVADTGIREATILGQAIGLALRGLRPLAEIQYLDYLLYALQIMADDLANLLWRTKGGQRAPVIVRTRGHRLEGIWHSGSPMAGILNLVRGMYVLVPRDMTRAAGFYNTLLRAEEPALLVEVLNGYRLRERLPDNIGEFTVPAGIPEVLRAGADISLVTYGACCRIVLEAAEQLSQVGIEAEVIDVQSLLPFDIQGRIVESLKKTGAYPVHRRGRARRYDCLYAAGSDRETGRLFLARLAAAHAAWQGAPPGLWLGRRLLVEAKRRAGLRERLRNDARS